jgi:excisionase family DNA binding protein
LARFTPRSTGVEWLGLGEASRLLGVAPGTLRRWSDSGRISAFTTPGGHRRYRRAVLERLLPSERVARPSLAHSGMTTGRLVRAYRQEARAVARGVPWLRALDEEQRSWFREHGRRLAEALLLHLDAAEIDEADQHLAAATAEAAEYGRAAARMKVSLGDAVEGFLQFRRPFLHQLALVARRRGLDATATTELIEASTRVMDRLLVAAMSAHSIERSRRPRRVEIETEGLT